MDLNPINLLFAMVLGAGLFALAVGVLYERPVRLSEVERVFGRGTVEPTLMERLQRALDDAHIDARSGEFIRVCLVLAVLAGLAAYILTGAPLAALIGFLIGATGYWLYLSSKASKTLAAYEDDLPQVVARLIVGARLKNAPLDIVAEHVAKFGPISTREDWSYIATQMRAGATRTQVFRVISQKRGSHIFNSLLELLLLQEETKAPLTDLLPPFEKSLQERVKTVRQGRTKLSGPIRELWIVSAAPFIAAIVMQALMPAYAEIYRSLVGQVILGVSWTVTLLAAMWAYRSFSGALEHETRFIGQLRLEPRSKLRNAPRDADAGEGSGPIRLAAGRHGNSPAALAKYTAAPSDPAEPGDPSS
jgi:Flp pilus assembly protein TadB